MASVTQNLTDKKLISPPHYVSGGIQYEVMMGSVAYGVSDDTSDVDLYGFCIPPKDVVFPHLAGEIQGFGRQIQRFDQFQKHHVIETGSGTSYDLSIYNIVKYFNLVMENNPNMVDSLFVPQRCIRHSTSIGNLVRENRHIFLHKGCWHKFKGYAYSQLHKMDTKQPEPGSKRHADVLEHGFDCKFGYHVVRLILEVEQILAEHDLDLERSREQLKSIRRGEWSLEQIKSFFTDKETELEKLYHSSDLPYSPDEPAIKNLLVECLDAYYGGADECVKVPGALDSVICEFEGLLERLKTCR